MTKEKISPGMQQYLDIKADYQDAFLLFRMGDFYELFYEDAVKCAQILELTLTSRNKNSENPIPMAGVPYHSVQGYIDTLVDLGYKVAIAEQMEDPKEAKGVVKREVVQVVTPGTYMSTMDSLNNENNYLTALLPIDLSTETFCLAMCDLATGDFKVTKLTGIDILLTELLNLQTKEIVLQKALPEELETKIKAKCENIFSMQEEIVEEESFSELMIQLVEEDVKEVAALLLSYLKKTQMKSFEHLKQARFYETNHFLKMDYSSKYNLEITKSIRNGKKSGTLFWLLDETKTAMGTRLLKQWLDYPLISEKEITIRQNMTQSLLDHFFERSDLTEALKGVYDLERLVARVSLGNANARDLLQLKNSLCRIPLIKMVLHTINEGAFDNLLPFLDECPALIDLLDDSICEEPPLTITEGGIIKEGFHDELDQFKLAQRQGSRWILELEQKEREATGIRTLRIDYNRKDGYYINVTNSNLEQVPRDRYYRKATLKNAERFGTEELQKLEATILSATEKSLALEYQLFLSVREEVRKYTSVLQQTAEMIATIDVLQSFAHIAESFQYVRPKMVSGGRVIDIEDGRHPVVEKVLGKMEYVPNSILMNESEQIQLITGPNMSGKSTYMRQLALITIMAQIGSFVPAKRAILPVFDKIFTRIGASDDLISGQSTFMVEMMESNLALRSATNQSLILFDELGRGTATYDGMALAQAIIEYIHRKVKAKTLFSTHYHELCDLEETLPHMTNVHVGAIEKNNEVIFLHKMMNGAADKSYGIHVAKIAGLPSELLSRAAKILEHLEDGNAVKVSEIDTDEADCSMKKETELKKSSENIEDLGQLSLFHVEEEKTEIAKRLSEMNIYEMTPMDAMNALVELKKLL